MEILNGIRIGQYKFDIDTVLEELKWRCISFGLNYAAFSVAAAAEKNANLEENLIKIAKFMKENKIYFSFSSTHAGNFGFKTEAIIEIKKIAGEYFLGCLMPECGSKYGCSGTGYGLTERKHKDLQDAKEGFVEHINNLLEKSQLPKELHDSIGIIEATSLLPYAMESKVTFPCLETMCGNPEIMIPLLRGTAKAHKTDRMMTYIAHEWYAGVRNSDILKKKRLRMAYDYSYMCGSNIFLLESGELCLCSHHDEKPFSNPVSENYRTVLREFSEFVNSDNRPEGKPKTKLAFVQGNLDGWSSWNCGSHLWNNFSNSDWGYGGAEFTWRIMDDINLRRNWHDVNNFGANDLSGAPAYGQYDIINATSSLETLMQYDYLIFTGWNSMTKEIYDNLKAYVQGGGILLMTAAHLNTTLQRDGSIELINGGDVSDLFGCILDSDNSFMSNSGFKFSESIIPDVMYPADSTAFDPLFAAGYVKYAVVGLTTGVESTILAQGFFECDETDGRTAVVENKCGKGYSILITGLDYPGSGPLYPMYKAIVRELVTSSHRACDIKAYGSDRLRFSVYDGNKIYLLNTDFDAEINVTVECQGEKHEVKLAPCEMKSIQL